MFKPSYRDLIRRYEKNKEKANAGIVSDVWVEKLAVLPSAKINPSNWYKMAHHAEYTYEDEKCAVSDTTEAVETTDSASLFGTYLLDTPNNDDFLPLLGRSILCDTYSLNQPITGDFLTGYFIGHLFKKNNSNPVSISPIYYIGCKKYQLIQGLRAYFDDDETLPIYGTDAAVRNANYYECIMLQGITNTGNLLDVNVLKSISNTFNSSDLHMELFICDVSNIAVAYSAALLFQHCTKSSVVVMRVPAISTKSKQLLHTIAGSFAAVALFKTPWGPPKYYIVAKGWQGWTKPALLNYSKYLQQCAAASGTFLYKQDDPDITEYDVATAWNTLQAPTDYKDKALDWFVRADDA
jgi:hypothetical protein